ncbi:hypothetical protein I6E81_02695 [Salinibacterium sp. NG22]|uniref:hypothetical protein n=1 Tax=Salinibacterium sp. NG22 TaxID=2792040 RepID=UPI0018CCE5BA|nr:hypothetical protein [Salinibacterium sp. NG22]MBH0109071.1 hypothetical protein [Salinibacterium sp. NG22]
MGQTIDYIALTERIDRADLKRSTAEAPESHKFDRGAWGVVAALVGVLVVLLSAFFVGMAVLFVAGESQWETLSWRPFVVLGPIIALLAFGYVRALMAFRNVLIEGLTDAKRYRLRRFASANGLIFDVAGSDPLRPGLRFGGGISVTLREYLRPSQGESFEYGNMTRLDAQSSHKSSSSGGGYLAIKLETSLPHIVLDARRNNSLIMFSALRPLAKDQILSLEGDFDKYFTLYCPVGYERDALYIFTPDLMALLIDRSASFDVEIVDNWLFVYPSEEFDLRKPELHRQLLAIVDVVAAKAISQTKRYRDPRQESLRPRSVASGGRRLIGSVSIPGVIVMVGLIIYPFLIIVVTEF